MGGVADDRKEWEIYIDARGTRRGIKLAEQLVYSGRISHEMVVHATRLESWEVSDVEHDIIHKKRSRLQQLRDLAYGIEEAVTDLDYVQDIFYQIIYWAQLLIYNRKVTDAEKAALDAYCTYEDVSMYEELKAWCCFNSLSDSEFVHKMHTYIDEVYAHGRVIIRTS